jgi:DNA-binding transcriptional LysR family regulator
MTHDTGEDRPPAGPGAAHHGLELRHLRYLVAIADAGTFTHAAARLFVTQPTLSQQIRRLEEMVGTPLLDRRPDGVRLTEAGRVLLEESRTVLSLVEHGVRRSRQAAGLGRPRLRIALPPQLPEGLAAVAAVRLWSVATLAGVEVSWLEAPGDTGFALIRQRRADAALGWVRPDEQELPDPLDAMSLGEFEPELWLPGRAGGDDGGVIGLAALAAMGVLHGPRGASPVTYDAWLAALRTVRPDFAFTDPPLHHSLSVALAFAAAAERPTGVLTGPLHAARDRPADTRPRTADPDDRPAPDDTAAPDDNASPDAMLRVRLAGRPLLATAVLAWNGDLPRHLQQVLFDTADSVDTPTLA